MSASITQLRVGDESFLVTSMIERCPKVMMLRELVRNAIEAAATEPATSHSEGRQVRFSEVPIDGVPKLAIWNNGRGMNAEELFRMCDIASSIRKEHRLDQNFGMGAKVASLPSNRHGLRYRSCHDGVVHEVMLGYRDGSYGRLHQADANGNVDDVIEASAASLAEGRDTGADWTEVVLFGNSPDQNTAQNPYNGMPGMPPHWLSEELAYRFFRIRDDVELRLEHQDLAFIPLVERVVRDGGRHSTVALPDGTLLHYVHDALEHHADAPYPRHGACGLVYKDELYNVHRWHDWLHVAPIFGVPFGARSISVFIELPDDTQVVPDGYRQFLRYAGNRQDEVSCRHFAASVHRMRPEWLIELVSEQAPSFRMSARVYQDLDRLLLELKVPRRSRASSVMRSVADAAGEPGAAQTTPLHELLEFHASFDVEPSPEILILRQEHEILARGIRERAGRYYPETHQLFLNGLYSAVLEMRDLLLAEYAWVPDQDGVRRQALMLSEQAMAARVGRMLVFGLSKQGKWHEHDVAQSYSVQALSLAADDLAQSLPAARVEMQAMLDAHSASSESR